MLTIDYLLQVAAINCLSAALSSSAFSTLVKDMLLAEVSAGNVFALLPNFLNSLYYKF